MRTWRMTNLTVIAVGFMLAGCQPVQRGSDEPTPTDGPNQVVIKVPDMT